LGSSADGAYVVFSKLVDFTALSLSPKVRKPDFETAIRDFEFRPRDETAIGVQSYSFLCQLFAVHHGPDLQKEQIANREAAHGNFGSQPARNFLNILPTHARRFRVLRRGKRKGSRRSGHD
jgi:hypothetical protein